VKRRSFLAGAATISTAALSLPLRADLPQHAIRVTAGQDRFNEPTRLGSTRSIDCKVSAKDSDGGWSAFESQWRTKGGPPLHVHRSQDEWFYAIKGEYIFQVGEDRFRLTAGDSILLPRQVPHTFAFVEDGEGKMIFAFQPAGDMEAFFREQSKLTGTPSAEEVQRMYRAHGLELVGPPLSL
jgi:mannose-6-phosphate isomerase-like protein (cupin superfamily)